MNEQRILYSRKYTATEAIGLTLADNYDEEPDQLHEEYCDFIHEDMAGGLDESIIVDEGKLLFKYLFIYSYMYIYIYSFIIYICTFIYLFIYDIYIYIIFLSIF